MSTIADNDECHYDNGGCEDICVNTMGSFRCACSEGYSLVNGFACRSRFTTARSSVLLAEYSHLHNELHG